MKCEYCGSDLDLPFRCPFCGKCFCVEHRLPETHMCPNFRRETKVFSRIWESNRSSSSRIFVRPAGGFRKHLYNMTSSLEIVHIGLATIIVALVGVSTAISTIRFLSPSLLLLLVLVFVMSFMLHEIGHKFAARYYGLWAEFRLSYLGVLVTLISIFTPFIKIISPGSVLVYGWADGKIIGKISLSGPLINIMLSTFFLTLNFLNFGGFLLKIAYIWGLAINAYVALFNLIPIGILDGAKIFRWNKYIWAISFAIALILTIAVYGRLY